MKNTAHLIFIPLLVFSISSCNKQPEANFTTDKDTYFAGETVHCKDASDNTYNWLWTAPDGKKYFLKDLDYPISINDLGGTKTFTLVTTSKNGKKNDSITKTIKVIPVPTPTSGSSTASNDDWFSYNGNIVDPTKIAWEPDGANWKIIAQDFKSFGYDLNCIIFLQGNFPPTLGKTYFLKSSYTSLSNDTACIIINHQDFEGGSRWSIFSTAGQLSISITPEFKVRAVFNNVDALYYTGFVAVGVGTNYKIAGDITCR